MKTLLHTLMLTIGVLVLIAFAPSRSSSSSAQRDTGGVPLMTITDIKREALMNDTAKKVEKLEELVKAQAREIASLETRLLTVETIQSMKVWRSEYEAAFPVGLAAFGLDTTGARTRLKGSYACNSSVWLGKTIGLPPSRSD